MKHSTRRLWMSGLKAMVGASLAASTLLASAQTFPTRPITLLVATPAGGATDASARVIAEEMSKSLGQPVVVENKPGASGMLATQSTVRAPADGHTIVLTLGASISNAPFVYKKVPYDTFKDLAFLTMVATSDLLLVTGKDVPANNMKEFMAWAKKNKGKLSYGSFGPGTNGHLIAAYLVEQHKLDMEHVPYKGEAPLVQDIVGGNVPWGFVTYGSALPFLTSGKLRVMAVMGESRIKDLPNVQTLREAGFKDPEYNAFGWIGMLAPANTPAPVLQRLEQAARAAVNSTPVRARMQVFGLRGIGNSSQEFRSLVERNMPVIEKLTKVAGVTPQ